MEDKQWKSAVESLRVKPRLTPVKSNPKPRRVVEMFSALKKLVGSETPVQQREKNIPAGLQSMNQSLQRRFAKGVQYNSESAIFI